MCSSDLLGVECTFLTWAPNQQVLNERAAELRVALAGEWQDGSVYQGVRPDAEVAAADAYRVLDRPFVSDPAPLPFATDFGNISNRVPAALIGVGREGGWAFHTDEGADQFASRDGEEAGLTLAKVMALATARLTG